MKTILITALLAIALNVGAQTKTIEGAYSPSPHLQADDVEYVRTTLYPATALLYFQDEDGAMQMRCTATAIEKDDKGYTFVTAAHCGCEDDEEKREVRAQPGFFFVTSDNAGSKEFLIAKPTGCGYRHRGDDFMLLHADTDKVFPVIPLGNDPVEMEEVVNVASPIGLGKQVFQGSVSAADMQRSVIADDINWTDATLLQLFGVNGGSSGSAVLCRDQRAICAFVVGEIKNTTIVAMPVSRLVALREQLKEGKYKYWQEDSEAQPKTKVVAKKKSN